MALQYISDVSGKHTAVIIPIKDWNLLKSRFNGLDQIEKTASEKSTPKPSDFKGAISKDTARKINAYVDESKDEWENNTF